MGDEESAARDAALVEAARKGDECAFGELYRGYTNAVRKIALDYVGDPDSADDVVQETFCRAWKHIGSLDDPARFRPWLWKIARNCGTDVQRGRMRDRRASNGDDELREVESEALGPDELTELEELQQLVRGSIVGLSVRDAVVVAMITMFGFSSSDAATAVGISAGNAKVCAHRVRKRLWGALGLQLIVRSHSCDCLEFRDMYEADPLGAARHVQSCPTCQEQVEREVVLYESEPDDPDPFGLEGLDE